MMDSVLFAVMGTSPPVLTETVWALAQESPATIPDTIVVLTTTTGRDRLQADLFDPRSRGWERLVAALAGQGRAVEGKLRFGMAADHIRLFPAPDGKHDLADMVTSAENEAAADFIMRELRSFTENPDTAVLASIAGGRKTMSALLMSCMSLLGRSQDRVLHVLVNPPYDAPLAPPFLFPEKGVKYTMRDGEKVKIAPVIELIDVPFVRMRGWYEESFKNAPPSYERLVAGMQRQAPAAVVRPRITLDRNSGKVYVENAPPVNVNQAEFAVLLLQFSGVTNHSDMAGHLLALKQATLPSDKFDWAHEFQASKRLINEKGELVSPMEAIETVRRLLSSLRAKIKKSAALAPLADELLPYGEAATAYKKIAMRGPDPFADIRGYP